MRRVRAGRASAWAGACLLAALVAACSSAPRAGRRGGGRPDVGVRLWVPPVVFWEAGADRHLSIAIENATDRTLSIAEPDPANARVGVFLRGDSARLCGVEPRSGSRAERTVELAPGDRVDVRVSLREACAHLPAGEYRFEVEYRSPEMPGGSAVSGMLGAQFGELFVAAASAEGRAGTPRAARSQTPRR